MSLRIAVAACLLVYGCRIGGGVEVVPIRGEAPAVIAVWPLIVADPPSSSPTWFTALADGCRRRGYKVVSEGVAMQLLRDAGLSEQLEDTNAIGRALRADALLQLQVRSFDFDVQDGVLHMARWDLTWRLLSTRGAGEQWAFTHHGNWHRADGVTFDPHRQLDDRQDARDIVPIGGNRSPGFRDVEELLAHLNNEAARHLPAN